MFFLFYRFQGTNLIMLLISRNKKIMKITHKRQKKLIVHKGTSTLNFEQPLLTILETLLIVLIRQFHFDLFLLTLNAVMILIPCEWLIKMGSTCTTFLNELKLAATSSNAVKNKSQCILTKWTNSDHQNKNGEGSTPIRGSTDFSPQMFIIVILIFRIFFSPQAG